MSLPVPARKFLRLAGGEKVATAGMRADPYFFNARPTPLQTNWVV